MSAPVFRRPNTPIVNWVSPGLGDQFAGINIYRQVARTPAAPLELAAALRVPPGRSPADVEAQHRWWVDLESGWSRDSDGRIGDGLNYWLSSVNKNGIESVRALAGQLIEVESVMGSWLTCNSAWWLSSWLQAIPAIKTSLANRSVAYSFAGRGREVTRTKRQRPAKRASGEILLGEHFGHDQAHVLEAIAASGRQVALSRKLGDRYLGTLEVTNLDDHAGANLDVGFEFIVTNDSSVPSDYNLPCGIVLDGTNDLVLTPHATDLDPVTGSWSFFFAGAGLTSAGSDYYLSKGAIASEEGYAIRTTGSANVVEVVIREGATTVTVTATVPTLFDSFDVAPEGHVIAGTYDATLNTLTAYVDGVQVGTPQAASLGTISNARALIAGANNNGSDVGTAYAAGLYRGHGVYARALSAADQLRLAQYLRGYAGVRAPANAVAFYDARDQACFSGVDAVLRDLAGNAYTATLVGSPVTRGIPAPLADIENAG